ncbi:FtsH protease activity modulator HflK [Sphingomonas jatrophae]|nr:FtsH protease activity modulator HflK [Sphingomonas jatrophae]
MLNESGGPWGGGNSGGSGGSGGGSGSGGSGGSGGGSGGGGDGLGPRNPWNQPPRKRPNRGPTPTALDEFLRRSRGRLPQGLPRGGRPLWGWAVLGLVALWIIFTCSHQIGPQQRGVVSQFGRYSRTLQPGIRFTFPLPIERVTRVNVDEIKTIDVGSTAASAQNLMLTGDQNIVDLAYSARWNIADPKLYLYELRDPEDTIREVAESAMRAEVARVSLNDAIGPQRSAIETRVQLRMQEILNSYRAGVQVQGIAIKQADPPGAVVDAFKSVSAAQQAREADLNQARAYAQQLSSKAEGEAAAFNKVYEQYRLSPEVTRRRMYYETMEDVLARTDKVVVETPGVAPLLPLPGAAPKPKPATEAGR